MDEQFLSNCLERMNCCNSKCVRTAVETLLRIHRKIFFNKNEPKYRKLKLDNEKFRSEVWKIGPAQSFMISCGWTQADNALFFNADENLEKIIDILVGHRFVTPQNKEWNEETKVENLNVSKQHEEMLRSKAALERQKQLEEYKKEENYRKELANNIKRQIADDKKHKREKFYREPVVGNKLERRPHLPSRGSCLSNPDVPYRRLN